MKFVTPVFYALAIMCFLLPWASVTCSVPSEEGQKKLKISQSGLQMISGASSLSADGETPSEEERKKMEDDDGPLNLDELDKAPLLILFPVALLIGLVTSFSMPRIASIAGGVAVVIGITQFAIGFPITEKIREMQGPAEENGGDSFSMDADVSSGFLLDSPFDNDFSEDMGSLSFIEGPEAEAVDSAEDGTPLFAPDDCTQDEDSSEPGDDASLDSDLDNPFELDGDMDFGDQLDGDMDFGDPLDMDMDFGDQMDMDFGNQMDEGMAAMVAQGFERHTEPYFWLSMACAILGAITGLLQGLGLQISLGSQNQGEPSPAIWTPPTGAGAPDEGAGQATDLGLGEVITDE
jgi:hypothetical protein